MTTVWDKQPTLYKFQLTRSVGSVTLKGGSKYSREEISTHTLRGERDLFPNSGYTLPEKFQLTRSVGSVTTILFNSLFSNFISTHTLRGERDH